MKKISLFALWLALSIMGFSQTIIYVRSGGLGDGSSWALACGLEAAAATARTLAERGERSEIWVKSGTYYPGKTVEIADMVKVYGGFDGSESKLSQRNYALNVTIIDAQKGFGVMTLGMNAVLNGFTIQNGSAHAPGRRSGGGVWMKELARVENCYLLNNQALDDGGGIYAEGDGVVVNTVLAKNKATLDGVAIYGSSLEVRNNTVADNALMHVTSNTDVSTPVEVCSGSRATLSVLDAGTYRWSSGETSAQITTAVLTAPTTYTVTVMPHDQSSVFELEFEVRVKAQPLLTISTNKSTANVGDTLVFTARATPLGGSYRWDDLSGSTDSVIKQEMQALGDLSYSCTYSLDGCVATATATVVNSRCTPPTDPDNLQTLQSFICIGDSLTMQLRGGQRNSGSWVLYSGSCGGTRLDSSKALAPIFKLKPTSSTTYYVRGEGCGEQTACVSVAITINPVPSLIIGPDSLCQNLDAQLTCSPGGGVWSKDASGLADISASGLATTKQPGIATLRYTLPATGCYREHKLTILAAPQYINGLDAFCGGTTTTYDGGPRKGGVFRVEPTTYASIDPITGVLTSSAVAPSDHKVKVYYAEPQHSCESFKEVNIYQKPLPIVGSPSVCEGDTLLLSNATTPAGLWFSSHSLVGDFVAPNSGLFAARTAGDVKVIYALGFCSDTLALTVYARPSAPFMSMTLCEGSVVPVSVSAFYPHGRWTLSPSTVAKVDSINPTTAVLTALAHGRYTLTYTLPTGCYSTREDSIYRRPTPIVGDSLLGLNTEDTLKSSPVGGFWQSTDNTVVSVQSYSNYALMEAVGVGQSTVVYTLPGSGCAVSKKITVEPCATITPPPPAATQQALCAATPILPIHYTFTHASKISLTWTDSLGQAIAQPAGILLDTTTTPNKATLSGNIALAGVYQYQLTTVDHFGGCKEGASVVGRIRIYQDLKGGGIGRDQSICQGTTPAAFNNIKPASGGAPGGTYLWQRQPVSSSSWQNLPNSNSLSFDDPSLIAESHRYRRQYSNACGVVCSDTVVVQIDSLPVVTSATIDSNTSCAGGNGKIVLALKNPNDVVMSIDNTNYQPSPIFSNLAAGTYTIDLRNTQSSCESEFTVEVKTSNRAVPQLKITGRDSICAGDSTLWRVAVVNSDGTSYRQQWSRVGNANLGQLDSVWLKGSASSYEVVVTHEATSCVASLSRGLKVMPPVVITEFSYFGKGDTVLCENENLRFKVGATSSGLPRTYAWHRAEDTSFSVGSMVVSTSSEFPYMVPTVRVRYYKAVVSSPYGICPSVSSPVIKVTSLERPKPAIAGPDAVCSGNKVFLSVSPQVGWSYRWLLGSDTLSKTHELDVLPLTSSNLYVLQTHNGYCRDQSTHTVDLRARPTFSYADVSSGTTVQSVCHNGTIEEIRAKVENATGLVLVWLGSPLSLSFDGTAMKLSGSVAEAAGTYPYLCYTTGQAPECAADTAKGAITILSPLDAGSISVPSFICDNSIPSQFSSVVAASGGASGGSYQWRQSTDSLVWSDIAGASDLNIQISTPLTQTMYYRRMYKNACGDVFTAPQTIRWRALPAKPTFAVVDNTNCTGGSNGSITVISPVGTNYEYSIQGNASYSANALFSPLVEDLYRISVRDKNSTCQNMDTVRLKNASGASNVPEFNILTSLPGNTDSVCSSMSAVTFTAQNITNCSGAIYRWVKASDTTTLSTTDSYTAPSTTHGEHYVLKITNQGGCEAVRWRTMTLVEPLTIDVQPQSDTACGMSRALSFSIDIGNVLGRSLRYQWQRRTTASGSAWENVGSSSNTYSTAQANTDTAFYFQCLVQVQNSAICPPLVSQQVHMQMLSTPVPKISGDTAICGGSGGLLSVPNIYKSYAWMLNGSAIAGATGPTLTTTPSTASQVYRVSVHNGYCQGDNMVTVKAYESPSILMPIPAEQNLCLNTAIVVRKLGVRHATGLAPLVWKRDGNPIAQPGGVTFTKVSQGKTAAGVDTCVYELAGIFGTVGTYTYTMSTTGHAVVCPAATQAATLIVNGSVQGGAIETASTEVCLNATAQPLTNKADGSGGYGIQGDGISKYQWYSDATGVMDAITGATGLSYNPAQNGVEEQLTSGRTYQRQYTNHCGVAMSNTLSITVKALDAPPTVMVAHQTSCGAPNGKITVTLPSGSDYEFSKDGGNTFQDSPFFSDLGAVAGLQVVARHKSSGCRTGATNVDILNKIEENRPTATLKVYPKDSVCANFNTVGIKAFVSQGGNNPTFSWNPAAPSADSISVTAPSQANALKITEYSLTVTNNETGCSSSIGASKHVYVFPTVVISQQPVGGAVCVDSMDNQVLHVRASNSSLPRNYQWERSSTQTGVFSPIAGATSFDYSVPTDSPLDYWYRCVVSGGYGICGAVASDAVRFRVVAKPSVPVIVPADQYICDGSPATLTAQNYDIGNSLRWGPNAGNATTSSVVVSPAAIAGTPDAPYNYSLSASNGICATSSLAAVVRVSRKHTINHVGDPTLSLHAQTACGGSPISAIGHNATAGAVAWATVVWRTPTGSTSKPSWISESYSGNALTISGTAPTTITDTGVYHWKIYTVGTANNVCPADTTTGTIVVDLKPAPALIYGEASGSTSACSDTLLVASGGSGGKLYFQGLIINGTSTAIEANTQTVNTTGQYYFRARSPRGCWSPEARRDVTIYATPSVTTQPSGADVTLALSTQTFSPLQLVVSPARTYNYQWYRNTTASNVGGIPVPSGIGGNTASYTPDNSLSGPFWYYCVISAECATTSAVSGKHEVKCSNPLLSIGTEASRDQVIDNNGCYGMTTVHHASSGASSYSITWTGPKGNAAPAGLTTVGWDLISGVPNVAASDTGIYFWTITAMNLSCATTSSGSLRIVPSLPKPVLAPNMEASIDGKLYVSDHQANVYKTVQIGSQTWLAENMRCTTSPSNVANWAQQQTGPSVFFPRYHQPSNPCYGMLYNWAAAMDIPKGDVDFFPVGAHQGICPSGWHIPTEDDWCALELHLEPALDCSFRGWRGSHAAELAATSLLWNITMIVDAPGNYANNMRQNRSGFLALPAGLYAGGFYDASEFTFFWATLQADMDHAWARYMGNTHHGVGRDPQSNKKSGFSVRCVKD